MERLTKREEEEFEGFWERLSNALGTEDFEYIYHCVKRLETYEDTGLTPEVRERLDASAGITTDRLRELGQAELDGRLVVLPPCKAGDLLWYVNPRGKVRSVQVKAFVVGCQSRHTDGAPPAPNLVRTKYWDIDIAQICKSVFLTRQEAEVLREQMKKDAGWS